jgi:adenylate cyclase
VLGPRVAAFAAITACVGAVALFGQRAGVWGGVDAQTQDLLQPGVDTGGEVALVGIDRRTLAATGEPWPWPRDHQAELLTAVAEAGAAVIVYDVVLADAGPADDELVRAITALPTVLASATTLRQAAGQVPAIVDAVEPSPGFSDAAAAVGHANVTVSPSRGVVRELPLYVHGERDLPVPSLALAAVAARDGVPPTLVERPEGVQMGDRLVPLDAGALRINWADELGTDDVVSALDVLEGTAHERLDGKVVVVGVTEPTLGDLHLVPTDRSGNTPGIAVHANAINTVLTRSYVSPASPSQQMAIVFGAVALAAAAFVWLRLTAAAVAVLLTSAAVVLFGSWRFHTAGELWPIVWPILGAVLAAVAGGAWRYTVEIRHKRRAWRLFSTYVPATVVDQLATGERLDTILEGERLDVAVVFCDLRGFTPIAATLEPAQVRALLDHYYDYTVAIVHECGGTVMQFVGDEVFSVFGAPVPWSDSVADALRCARRTQDEVARLDAALEGDGLPPIRFGISVHAGPVVAAHVGTAGRRQYAVIGDTVNVGSRLCGKAAAGEVVASAAAAAIGVDTPAASFEPDDVVELTGVAEPMPIHRYGGRVMAG